MGGFFLSWSSLGWWWLVPMLLFLRLLPPVCIGLFSRLCTARRAVAAILGLSTFSLKWWSELFCIWWRKIIVIRISTCNEILFHYIHGWTLNLKRPSVTSINFLLTVSVKNHKEMSWELVKWSLKEHFVRSFVKYRGEVWHHNRFAEFESGY